MFCVDCKIQINDCDLFTCKDCNIRAHRVDKKHLHIYYRNAICIQKIK